MSCLISCFLTLPVLGQEAEETGMLEHFWGTDKWVRTILVTNDTVYLGGDFHYVGPPTRAVVGIDVVTGDLEPGWPQLGGSVHTAISDGDGGWFVGGLLFERGGPARHLAHILPDGSLDADWNPAPDFFVRALALQDNVLYVGGQFTQMGEQPRPFLAAVDAATGQLTDWNPMPDERVVSLVAAGERILAGGGFQNIGGGSRPYLAAVDRSTGLLTSWDPAANNQVQTMVMSGNRLYVGGAFQHIGQQPRSRLAELDLNTGLATDWNPGADRTVFSFALAEDWIYVGGGFSELGGVPRNRIGAVTRSTGTATSWRPDPQDAEAPLVQAVVLDGDTVYIGGRFTSMNGVPRPRLAAVDALTGEVTPWDTGASAPVQVLGRQDSTLFVGADDAWSIGGKPRRCLAALERSTGKLKSWNPQVSGDPVRAKVASLVVTDDTVYFGGEFGAVGGLPRNSLGAVDALTGDVRDWTPNLSSPIHTLALYEDLVLIGGGFIVPDVRRGFAAVDRITGQTNEWSLFEGAAAVHTMDVRGEVLYLGGLFTDLRGLPREHLGAIDLTSGQPTDWAPTANSIVLDLVTSGEVVYVCGGFRLINGVQRNGIAPLDAVTGELKDWTAGLSGSQFNSIAVRANTVFTTGFGFPIGNTTRFGTTALDATEGRLLNWNVRTLEGSPGVHELHVADNLVFAGGDFFLIAGVRRQGLAVFDFGALEPIRLVGMRVDLDEQRVRFQIAGPPGMDFGLETSTDLSRWDPIQTGRLSDLGLDEHTDGAEGPMRYYRAIKLEGQ